MSSSVHVGNAGSVGLDIGNSSIKLIQVRQRNLAVLPQITGFVIEPLPSQEFSSQLTGIKKVLERARIGTKAVNTSVAGQNVVVRYIQLPKMTVAEVRDALALNAGQYIPFPLSEVNVDFQILSDPKSTDKMMRVLLVAVKKTIIDERVALLHAAGLTPRIIDVDSFAVVNCFQLVRKEHAGVIAIVDIGADTTTTTVLADHKPYFSRDVPLGGNDITRAIAADFELTPEQAEMLKAEPADQYGDVLGAITPILSSLCRELHMSFSFCEGQLAAPVASVYLSGGTAKFKGIEKVFSGMLGLDVRIWDPIQMIPIDAQLPREQICALGPLLTVALGLALR